ncbi:unnamed protein product, partial [Rotaria sp. Silwood2]
MIAILYFWTTILLIETATTIGYDNSLNNHHNKNLIEKESSLPQLGNKEHETNYIDTELDQAFSSNIKALAKYDIDFGQ